MSAHDKAEKRLWFILFGFFVLVVPLMMPLVQFMRIGTRPSPFVAEMHPALQLMEVAALLVAMTWAQLKLRIEIGVASMAPHPFRKQTVWTSAIALISFLLGVFLFDLSGMPADYVMAGAGTEFVLLAFILPKGLKYWANWEAAQ